jgi:dTDP-4-dehydrorhamnose 3,5-epimerase
MVGKMGKGINQDKFTAAEGYLDGCKQDVQSVTSEWDVLQDLIDGVRVRQVKHVAKNGGWLTEMFRRDWLLDDGVVDQVFQVNLYPGEISAWHAHRVTKDRLFVSHGQMRVVLYDARDSSPTHQRLNEFVLGVVRPALVVVPPGVWHGIQAVGNESAALINMVDAAYRYQDPDHWRLPWDTDRIPYRFQVRTAV